MMKKVSLSILSICLILSFAITAFGGVGYKWQKAKAEELGCEAYIHYAASDGNEFNGVEEGGVIATKAQVTGVGTYTVSLDLRKTYDEQWKGITHLSIDIPGGENTFAMYTARVWTIIVNGSPVSLSGKPYITDVQGTTSILLYGEPYSNEKNKRSYDGDVESTTNKAFTEDQIAVNFRNVRTLSIEFSFVEPAYSADIAYLMFCDNNFTYPYNAHVDQEIVNMESSTAYVLGPGEYTVGLEFTNKKEELRPNTVKFMALNIATGASTFASYKIKAKSLKVNGKEIALGKGYTCDSETLDGDGNNPLMGTRYFLFHGWLEEIEDVGQPRTWEDSLEGASPRIIEESDLVSVVGTGGDAYLEFSERITSIEVTFEYIETFGESVDAYLEYCDDGMDVIYYGEESAYNTQGVVSEGATINKVGRYSLKLDFSGTSTGVAKGLTNISVVIRDGERHYTGYAIKISNVVINGTDVITSADMTKGVTYPSGTLEEGTYDIRFDLYTTLWSTMPQGARSFDNQTRGASGKTLDVEKFANVATVEVNFEFVFGVVADDSFNAAEYLSKDYNAYMFMQTENYIFRNEWYDADYGIEGTYKDKFYTLVGWDAELDGLGLPPEERWIIYGGEFNDTQVQGNGAYSVSLKLGESGFGSDTYFRALGVSTDIPSQLYNEGHIDFSDVKIYFDDQPVKEFFYINTEKEYLSIVIVSEYVSGVGIDSISYSMPVDHIQITFNVVGFDHDNPNGTEPIVPEPPVSSEPTNSSTSSDNTNSSSAGGCNGGIGGSTLLLGSLVAACVVLKRRKDSK